MNPWTWWVERVGRPVDSRPITLVLQLVVAVLLWDLLSIAWFDLTDAVLFLEADGGLTKRPQSFSILPAPWGGRAAWVTAILAAPFILAGKGRKVALVVFLVAHSQLGHWQWPGDRGIDRILRTVLVVLLFSDASRDRPPRRVAAWPVDLLTWLLVIIYLDAGYAKLDAEPGWLSLETNELYTVLADPLAARLDGVWWAPHQWFFALGGLFTLVLEFSAPLMLFRRTRATWAAGGVFLHVGIWATMRLGIFPAGMLALYPILFRPHTEKALDRLGSWLGREPPPVSVPTSEG